MSNIVLDNGQSIVTKSSNGRKGIPVDARTQVQYYKDIQNIEYAYENLQVIVTDDDPEDPQHPKGVYVVTKLDGDNVDLSGIKSLKDAIGIIVEANPVDEATDTLDKIKIGNKVYKTDNPFVGVVDATDAERTQALANVSNQTANSTTGKMGYKVLDPTKTFASQVTSENTIFEIRDVFDLGGTQETPASVTIPANCTLKFNGGMLKNGNILLNNTTLDGNVSFGENLTLANGSTVTNKELCLSWFNVDYRTEGLQNLFDLQTTKESTKNIFIDVSELSLNHPIVCGTTNNNVGKMIVHGLGMRNTRITPSNDWSADGYDRNAFFFVRGNWNNAGGFSDMALDGGNNNIVVGYGIYWNEYLGFVRNIEFSYLYAAAIMVRSSEKSFVEHCRFLYCGCAVYCNPYGVKNENNLLDWRMSSEQTPYGTISQFVFAYNYVVVCNYGVLMATADLECQIVSNCISYTSCYGVIVRATRTINIEKNYLEGCGVSCFWIRRNQPKLGTGSPSDEWGKPDAQKTMPDYLAQTHEDIGGLSMQGWGFPHGEAINPSDVMQGTTLYIRPIIVLEGIMATVKNNYFSMNWVRTKLSDEALSNDNTALGVDTIFSFCRIENVLYEQNDFRISGNDYAGNPRELSKYSITFNEWTITQVTTTTADAIGRSNYIHTMCDIKDCLIKKLGNQWIYKPLPTGNFVSELSEGFNTFRNDLTLKSQMIDIANKCGPYAHVSQMTPVNIATYTNKNIYNLSGGNILIKDDIPFYKINAMYLTLWKGYSFIIEKELFKGNTNFMFGLYNDNNGDTGVRDISIQIYKYSKTASATRIAINHFYLQAKECVYKSVFIPVNAIDTDYIGICISHNVQEGTTPLGDVYMTVPYPQCCMDKISYDIDSDRCDELGRLNKGSTDERPPLGVDDAGFKYYDKTLGEEIIWNGSEWKYQGQKVYHDITNNVTSGIILDNDDVQIENGQPYIANISTSSGLKVDGIKVVMSGIDISNTAFIQNQQVIYIPYVTGDVVISQGVIEPNYLTFTAKEANSSVAIHAEGTAPSLIDKIEYSTDGGTSWNSFVYDTPISLTNIGDKLVVRGQVLQSATSSTDYNNFVMTGTMEASGDVSSLVNGIGGKVDLTVHGGNFTLAYLFKNCTSLVSAPNVRFGTIASSHALEGMFKGCTSLTGIVNIDCVPSTYSYASMFHSCSLVDGYVFENMNDSTYIFVTNNSCKSLVVKNTVVPTIASTTLIGLPDTTCTIYVPYSEDHSILAAYKTTGEWKTWYDAAMLTSRTTEAIQELDENGEIPT